MIAGSSRRRSGPETERHPGPPASSYWLSRGLLGQEASNGLFSLFGCLRHAFKKAGRAFYRPQTTGTIDFPPPGLRRNSLVSSRRTNSRTGQIPHSCIIDSDSLTFSAPAAISDPLIMVRPSGTSLGTSKPTPKGRLAEPPSSGDLTLGTDRGTLNSFFLSVPSSCPHQDEGWHLHQPATQHGGLPETGMWPTNRQT